MSLIRQICLLLLAVVLLATTGGVAVNVLSARETLQTQLQLKNGDNAQSLALALSQQHGEIERMNRLMSAQFDTGSYERIKFIPADGSRAYERRGLSTPARAPEWFADLLPIEPHAGMAPVSDGVRLLGSVEVMSQVSFAYDHLWRGAQRTAVLMLAIGLLAGAVAYLAVRRIREPLDATVKQARALIDGRFVLVDEPQVPELQRVAAAMNAMVLRVRSLFDAQAAQAESLRRRAHSDPLTGLPHRSHFVERLNTLLTREDGLEGGGLVIVRLADPARLNRTVGRETADRALLAIAQVMQTYPARAPDCVVGRLNGSDFALCLPSAGLAGDTARSISAALQTSLPAFGAGVRAQIGAVELRRDSGVGSALAQADLALATAESRGGFAVEVIEAEAAAATPGERGWRVQILSALEEGRARLGAFALLDREGATVHLECPLRLQLASDGAFEPAARWLPLAARNRLTATVDGHAVALALEAIAADGQPRSVNIAPASLLDGGFAVHLRSLALDRPQAAHGLWIEVAETAAIDNFERVQELSQLLRPQGVKVGLEHAGQRLHRIERLYELGLHYVKLDASLCIGVATQESAREFVRSTVALLHALALQVHAEGLDDDADVAALWDCGVDGVTGPWASRRLAEAG